MVVLEDIRVGNYFIFDNREVIEVQEKDFTFIPALAELLTPLPINYDRLRKLGFENHPGMDKWYKASPDGKHIYLRQQGSSRWMVQFEQMEKVRVITYVHELQNLYFWLFSTPLQKPAPKEKITLKPTHSFVRSFFVNRGRGRQDREPIPPVQPYYLSWDCQFLVCTSPAIMWQIIDDNYAFEYAGRRWGLKLVLGMATNQHDEMATDWLKDYLKKVLKA